MDTKRGRNTSIKGKESEEERGALPPLEKEKSCKGEKKGRVQASRTLSEDLNPVTHSNERLS